MIISASCSKDHKQTTTVVTPPVVIPVVPSLIITSAEPLTGSYLTQVTITGKNFIINSIPDTVLINSKLATISYITNDTLIVSVPLGAVGSDSISVRVNGITSRGPVFTYVPALVVSTIAGNGISEFPINGASTTSTINAPVGITVDAQDNVYVAEFNRIKKISPSGELSVFSGSGVFGFLDSTKSYAEFKYPTGLAIDLSGNVIVADRGNSCIRKITPDGSVTTIAGSTTYGFADGVGVNAKFNNPTGVAVDQLGNIFISDNCRVRKITPDGAVTTVAGNGTFGYNDGAGSQAEFYNLGSIALDQQGNIYVYETSQNRIRMISSSGMVSTYAGSRLNLPSADQQLGMTVDIQGNVYIGDGSWGSVSKISPSAVTYYAGNGTVGYKDGDAATAQFNQPTALAVDSKGNIYVCDIGNSRIRKITNQ